MERERWLILYGLIVRLDKDFPSGWKFSTGTIVAVFFWAVLHDRPVCWACDADHWPEDLRLRPLPSQDRMSRRLPTPAVQGLLRALELALQEPPQPVKTMDSKPLTVGVCSKDRETRWGVVTGGRCLRGYKFHAIWAGGPLPIAWRITPMNAQDGVAGRPLLKQLTDKGCVLGDGQYDQNTNYEEAHSHGHQLIALPRCPGAGRGHRPQSAYRLLGLQLQAMARQWFSSARSQIEREFSGLTCFGGGLACLPSWIRGPTRVTRWVQAKIIVNALRIKANTHSLANA